MLEELKSSPIAWSILSLLTIVGVILSVYFGIKSKRIKRFSYAKNSYRLVAKGENTIDKLKLTFDNKEVENAVITKITIWNSGNTVINDSDIVSEKRLRISTKQSCQILESKIIAYNEKSNKALIKVIDDNNIEVSFEYFDVQEGLVIQIIHTGEPSDIDVFCKIKGGKPLKNVMPVAKTINKKSWRKIRSIYSKFIIVAYGLFLLILLSLPIAVVISKIGVISQQELVLFLGFDLPSNVLNILCVFILVFALIFSYAFIEFIKMEFKMGIPSKLKKYLDFEF